MVPTDSVAILRVRIGEKEIELQGEPEHIAKVIAHLLAQGTATVEVDAATRSQAPPAAQPEVVDIRQFFDMKKPSSDNEAAVAAAYYYAFIAPPHERHDTIDKDLLQKGFTEAHWELPGSIGMTLVNARNMGYLSQAGRGTYRLTTVGQNLVTHALGKTVRPGSAKPRVPRRRKPSTKSRQRSK